MGVCYPILRMVLISGFALAAEVTLADSPLFTYRSADGVTVFSDSPVDPGNLVRRSYRSTMRPIAAPNPCKGLTRHDLQARGRALNEPISRAAALHSVDEALIKAVARAESCFDPRAVSSAGARGLMQLMPATARFMGVSNINDEVENLNGGAKYLAMMLERYAADTRLALAAYNAGPGNVDRYGGIPPFPETQRYIETVMRYQALYATAENPDPGQRRP